MQKIRTHLWFDDQAEEAAEFYTSLFADSRITGVSHYPEGSPGTPGAVMNVTFELAGQEFIALNAGPHFKFNEAISLFVDCGDQAEVDRLWEALTANGGEESQCGWLKDRWGLSWQVIPRRLGELMQDEDPAKASAVVQCMLQMRKIDVPELEKAYANAG